MTDIIKIRSLNDSFRQTLVFGGTVLVTPGVTSLSVERQAELLERVRTFDRFTLGDYPHGEHNFGSIELDATRFFFKIDYYDPDGKFASPDAADPAVTRRVMNARRALVGAALSVGMRQDVLTADLVVQGIEAIAGVQRRLQFLNGLFCRLGHHGMIRITFIMEYPKWSLHQDRVAKSPSGWLLS